MIIETERLVLRKWTQEDAESLFSYAGNPNVMTKEQWESRYSSDAKFGAGR